MLEKLSSRSFRSVIVQVALLTCVGLVTAACGGISFGGGEGCSIDGQDLEVGDSVTVDCNQCVCEGDDTLACTSRACEETDDGESCETSDGSRLVHGATRTRNCESCTCDDGELSCEEVCEPNGPDSCELADGEVIADGESFEVSCNECRCDDGIIECTEEECETDRCELDGDEWLDDGDSFEVGCNECQCRAGTLSCSNRNCAAQCTVDGDRFDDGEEIPSTRSCESCVCSDGDVFCLEIGCDGSCEWEGKEYAAGEQFMDDCNQCECDDGDVICTDVECGPASCLYEGQEYQDGEAFEDACNDCVCSDGEVSCTDAVCGCELNGTTYGDGDTVPSNRSCESCVCDNGDVACVSIGCTSCEDESGDGEYEDGEQWPGSTPCTTCTCNNGSVSCVFSGCPDPVCEGDDGPLPNGSEVDVDGVPCECIDGQTRCAEAGACEVRGVTYANGTSVPDPNSCNQCTCVDGEVTACTEIACPVLVIEPCDADHDESEDYRHEAVAIDDGYLTIDVEVSGTCEGPHGFDVCYDPISSSGSTPETALHLIHHDPGAACDDVGTQRLVVDLYPFTSEEGFDEVFFDLGRHRLLYVAP